MFIHWCTHPNCNPNISKHSRPKHMVIYAIYPIRESEQLLHDHGKHYAIMSRATRQQKLLKHYFFTCDCIACQEDWPFYHELQSFKTLVKKPEDKAKINEALRKFNMCALFVADGNVQDKPFIIEEVLKMVQVLHDCASMPCFEMTTVVEMLKHVYDLNGNIFEIPQVWTYRK